MSLVKMRSHWSKGPPSSMTVSLWTQTCTQGQREKAEVLVMHLQAKAH